MKLKLTENDVRLIISKTLSFILLNEIYKRHKKVLNESSYAENIEYELQTAYFDDIAKMRERLLTVALKLTKNLDRAEDLVQNTIARAFEKSDLFNANTNLFGWLVTIMKNLFKREMDNPRRRMKYIDDYTMYDKQMNDTNDDIISYDLNNNNTPKRKTSEVIQDMYNTVNDLSKTKGEIYNTVFSLKMKGEKIKDMADALNLSNDRVKYILRDIRNCFRKKGYDDEIRG